MISPEMLRRYPYFAPIQEDTLHQIAMIAEERFVEADYEMFPLGTPADHLFVIIDGEVDIQYVLPNGEHRTVDTLIDGDLLVWSALVAPYLTTGIGTTTKPTHLIAIEAAPLRAICEEDPQLGYRLMTEVSKLLSHRLEGARVQLAVADWQRPPEEDIWHRRPVSSAANTNQPR